MTGGSSLAFAPLLAGAATGAGIASLRGEDPLMGAFTGGLGGYGGGELGKAAAGVGAGAGAGSAIPARTTTLPSGMVDQGLGGITKAGQTTVNMPAIGTAPPTYSATTAAKNLFTNPGGVISNLGGGDISKGALKAGAIGLPAVAGAMVPDMTTAEVNEAKFDPTRRLNLNRPTGLRLLQEGGYLETGVGDGVSDEIRASIDGQQPVLLSENEFVIPADVVSGLGNGSSDAGAEKLFDMMDRVRKARTGTKEMGKEITAERLMPA